MSTFGLAPVPLEAIRTLKPISLLQMAFVVTVFEDEAAAYGGFAA
jgi:hypothetical protein